MFINILPPTVQKEVREKTELTTLQKCIDHVLSDLGRINDAHLSKMHMERLKQSLSSGQRISPVIEIEENGDGAAAVGDGAGGGHSGAPKAVSRNGAARMWPGERRALSFAVRLSSGSGECSASRSRACSASRWRPRRDPSLHAARPSLRAPRSRQPVPA